MAFPETIPKNHPEEAEREAPAFESVEQPISPEEQVKQAMEAVEAAKKEFDTTKADAEMASDQREYAERLGVPPESIAEADEAIAEELSVIKKEEVGLLAKLNEKLRKYAGVVGLAAATAGPATAEEGPTGDIRPESDAAKIVEVMPGDALPKPEVSDIFVPHENGGLPEKEEAEALLSEVPSSDIPDEVMRAQEEADDAVASGTVRVASLEDIRKDMEREERQRTEEVFESEFQKRDFASETEVLEYLHEGASRFNKEFAAIYGVKRDGSIVKAVGQFGDNISVAIYNADKIIKRLKDSDVGTVQFAHTHPPRSIESALDPEYSEELKKRGVVLDHVPPSLPDIRTASNMYWSDIYDDPKSQSDRWWDAAKTEGAVIDAGGTWKYRVDYYHPYIVQQRDAAVDNLLGSRKVGEEKRDQESARSSLRALVGADPIILERMTGHMPEGIDFYDILRARTEGSLSQDGEEYEYTKQQFDVLSASPEESKAAIGKFIAYCKERGIDISYTPFQKE